MQVAVIADPVSAKKKEDLMKNATKAEEKRCNYFATNGLVLALGIFCRSNFSSLNHSVRQQQKSYATNRYCIYFQVLLPDPFVV